MANDHKYRRAMREAVEKEGCGSVEIVQNGHYYVWFNAPDGRRLRVTMATSPRCGIEDSVRDVARKVRARIAS